MAVKIIEANRESFLKLANNEVNFLSRCKSSNIVQYKEFYTLQNKIAVIMELCEEKDLSYVIKQKKRDN